MTYSVNTVGLVLEGISGSGKSTVLGGLLRSESYLQRGYLSSIVLSEHHTQRVLEPKQKAEGLSAADNVALLRQNVDMIHALDLRLRGTDWGERGRLNHRLSYLMERFHLTHVCHYEHVGWKHVRAIDDALAGLGCKLCLLRVDEAMIEERVVNLRRNKEWEAYLSSVGSHSRGIVDHYVAQQERFLALREASSMPSVVVDTSGRGVNEVVAEVSAFWLSERS